MRYTTVWYSCVCLTDSIILYTSGVSDVREPSKTFSALHPPGQTDPGEFPVSIPLSR